MLPKFCAVCLVIGIPLVIGLASDWLFARLRARKTVAAPKPAEPVESRR